MQCGKKSNYFIIEMIIHQNITDCTNNIETEVTEHQKYNVQT